jgi:hypothetical protein
MKNMKSNFFFWGVTDNEEVWKILHDHFEKLAREVDDTEETVRSGKAVKRK